MLIQSPATTVVHALLYVLVVASATGKRTTSHQQACLDNEVVLECPAKDRIETDDFNKPIWRKNTSLTVWTPLASLAGSLLYENGSVRLAGGRAEGIEAYKCQVRGKGQRETHYVYLKNIKCRITKDACLEEEVVLECPAKDRVNPEDFKELIWRRNMSSTDWARLAKMNAVGKISINNESILYQNGSLRLAGGRTEGIEAYKCQVRRKDGKSERYSVYLKNRKCRTTKGSVKTTQGRVTMTTATPTQPPDVLSSSRHAASTTPCAPSGSAPDNLTTRVCGGVLMDPAGSFQSPNFPSAYPANSHCKWTISLPQDYAAINITLGQVNLEGGDNCQHDYIAIYDELGNQIGCRICGIPIDLPNQVQVRGKTAVVVFKSDGSENKIGFQASYQAVL